MSLDETVYAILLAGGRGQRLGGSDKGLLPFRAQPLAQHVLDRLAPQAEQIVISANRHVDRYALFNHPVVTDGDFAYHGPLAGICSALRYILEPPYPSPDWVLLAPCDTPFYPIDLAACLLEGLRAATAQTPTNSDWLCLIPHDGTRYQPLCSMLRPSALAPLESALIQKNYKVQDALLELPALTVAVNARAEGFFNINYIEQLNGGER